MSKIQPRQADSPIAPASADGTAGGLLRFAVQQALYSSALTKEQAGYQLVARSVSIEPALARELVGWCPTHDSLCAGSVRALSFFPLSGGHWGIGYTTPTGDEYSGRRGECITTQVLVFTTAALAAFGYHPLRLFDAARAGGHLRLPQSLPQTLPEFRLLAVVPEDENSSPALHAAEQTGDGEAGPEARREARGVDLARLLSAHRQVAVMGAARPLRYAARLLDELPSRVRRGISFSAALRYSPQRPFRLLVMGDDAEERRRLRRTAGLALVEADPTLDE